MILPLLLVLHPQFSVMSWGKGFFTLFLVGKSEEVAGSSSARVHGHSSSWTPAAYEEITQFGVRTSENTFVDASGDSWLLLSGTAHGSC